MSGTFSLADFVKTKPNKKNKQSVQNQNQNQNQRQLPSSQNIANPQITPHMFQMEHEMRGYLNQLLEKMFATPARREEIIEKLIQEMRENAANFHNIFASYRTFYDHISRFNI